MRGTWTVCGKELVDTLRDRKSMLMLLLTVLVAPLMLLAVSAVIQNLEEKEKRREVFAVGMQHAPDLNNFLARQGFTVKEAPDDYEAGLRSGTFRNPVVVVPEGFTERRANGEVPDVRIVVDSSNREADMQTRRLENTLHAYRARLAGLELAMRGVSAGVLEQFSVQRDNLADQQSRSSAATGSIAFIVLFVVATAALVGSLDSMAGERERGSLQPLLLNPVSLGALVSGKWLAVAALAMGVATLNVLSYIPGQWLLQSETLRVMFRFGLGEAALFLLMLLPFAGALSALLLLVTIHGRSFKEAQTSASVLLLGLQMLPMLGMLSFAGEKAWHLWVPTLAQYTIMMRVLRGDVLTWQHLVIPTAVSLAVTALCLYALTRRLRALAVA